MILLRNLNRLLVVSATWKELLTLPSCILFSCLSVCINLKEKFKTFLDLMRPWLQEPSQEYQNLSVIFVEWFTPQIPSPFSSTTTCSRFHHPPTMTLSALPLSSHAPLKVRLITAGSGAGQKSSVTCCPEFHCQPAAGLHSQGTLIVKHERRRTEKRTRMAGLCVRDTLPCMQTDACSRWAGKADSLTYHQLEPPIAPPTYPQKSLQKAF